MALEGIRVLDLTVNQQGPACTTYLADMGADVIKIEGVDRVDPGRYVVPILNTFVDNAVETDPNYYFEAHNRNKRGIAVDLKKEAGKEVIYRLVPKSDVFATNLRKQAVDRLGLSYETLSRYNPRLIYARASGYGPRGPDKDKPGYDFIGQAKSGLMRLATEEGQPPSEAGVGLSDQTRALNLAFGILAALLARERYGVGQEVDCSLFGASILIHSMWLQHYLLSGVSPTKAKRSHNNNPFWRVYEASDGKWLILSMADSDAYWPALCRVASLDDVANRPEFASHALRMQNAAAIIHRLDKAFVTKPAAHWVKSLQAEGVVCDLVYDYEDIVNDPQVWANEYIAELDLPDGRRIKVPGIAATLSKTPGKIRKSAPPHGQDTEAILTELAGYTGEEIARLREEGVIK